MGSSYGVRQIIAIDKIAFFLYVIYSPEDGLDLI